jgi:DNA-binding MarR family transcriptional regulator
MSIVSQTLTKDFGPAAEPTRPEHVIPHLLKNLHHSVRQAVDEAFRLQRIEMSLAHFVVLLTLEYEPGIAGAELARRGFVTAQTMNSILRRMERDGDIERRPHPGNARADSWFVTKSGQAHLERARVVGEAVWMRMLSALKASEIKQLQNMLERCIKGMDVQLNGVRMTKPAKTATAAKTVTVAKTSRRRSAWAMSGRR